MSNCSVAVIMKEALDKLNLMLEDGTISQKVYDNGKERLTKYVSMHINKSYAPEEKTKDNKDTENVNTESNKATGSNEKDNNKKESAKVNEPVNSKPTKQQEYNKKYNYVNSDDYGNIPITQLIESAKKYIDNVRKSNKETDNGEKLLRFIRKTTGMFASSTLIPSKMKRVDKEINELEKKPNSIYSINAVKKAINSIEKSHNLKIALQNSGYNIYSNIHEATEAKMHNNKRNEVLDNAKKILNNSLINKVKDNNAAPLQQHQIDIEHTDNAHDLYTIGDEDASVLVKDLGDNEILIDMVRTEPAYRQKGYARAIMNKVIADNKGKKIMLSAEPQDSSTTMDQLVKFYNSVGFEITEVTKDGTKMEIASNKTSTSKTVLDNLKCY